MKTRNKVIATIVVLLILVVGFIFLQNSKYQITWQKLTIIGAALIAPFRYIFSLFSSDKEKITEIHEHHDLVREQEEQYRLQIEQKIQEKEKRVEILNQQVDIINSKIKNLEVQNDKIVDMVKNMSLEEKSNKIDELFGKG